MESFITAFQAVSRTQQSNYLDRILCTCLSHLLACKSGIELRYRKMCSFIKWTSFPPLSILNFLGTSQNRRCNHTRHIGMDWCIFSCFKLLTIFEDIFFKIVLDSKQCLINFKTEFCWKIFLIHLIYTCRFSDKF